MALYLGGSEKLEINIKNTIYRLNTFSKPSITNGIELLSFENYVLKSSDGLYLIAKEDE